MLNCLEIFRNSISSASTLITYTKRLEEFHKFTKIKDYDSYTKMDSKQNEMLIMEYIQYLKDRIDKGFFTPNSMHIRISPILLFMSQNDIILNIKKIKKCFPRTIKAKGELPYKIKDIQAMIENCNTLRDKSIISFFASTGVRMGAIPDLQMKHLKDMDSGCMSVLIYADDKEEYTAFLTPEATSYLKKYFENRENDGEKLTETSPIFRNTYRYQMAWKNVKPISYNALKFSIHEIISKSGINEKLKDSNQKHHKAQFGAFRKFFETTLNDNNKINPNITEKLMGHRNDLRGTYYNPTNEKRFDEFQKAIPELTISDKQRDAMKIQAMQTKQDEIEVIKEKLYTAKDINTDKITEIEAKFKNYEKHLAKYEKIIEESQKKQDSYAQAIEILKKENQAIDAKS